MLFPHGAWGSGPTHPPFPCRTRAPSPAPRVPQIEAQRVPPQKRVSAFRGRPVLHRHHHAVTTPGPGRTPVPPSRPPLLHLPSALASPSPPPQPFAVKGVWGETLPQLGFWGWPAGSIGTPTPPQRGRGSMSLRKVSARAQAGWFVGFRGSVPAFLCPLLGVEADTEVVSLR